MRFAVYIRLPEHAYDALISESERQWRDPRDQAAVFVIEGLERAGAIAGARSRAEDIDIHAGAAG